MTQLPTSAPCRACRSGAAEPIAFTMAFQPIVDTVARSVFAYEALVRSPENGSAWSVLSQVTPENRYHFDQACRVKAITLASSLGLAQTSARLSINFMPEAVYSPVACIQLTLKTAHASGFPTDRLIFEIVESEQVRDPKHLCSIVTEYRKYGIQVALDDFGSGFSGLGLLADVPTEIVKLDMELTRNLHQRPRSITLIRSLVELADKLGAQLIAEGVETIEEYRALQSCGIRYMQGYLLARPEFEALPNITLPD